MDNIKRILIISSDKDLREVLEFCFDGWGYEVYQRDYHAADINGIKKISPDAIVIDVHSASKTHLELCHLLKGDFMTAYIPIIALINKRELRQQLLNIKQGVDDYLIKPPDPLDLRTRMEIAIKRSRYSFYSSPLTALPGGTIIEEVLREKIKKDYTFSFGHVDIDNFKYFNDVYGYLKGDRVITQTAYMLYTALKRFGNKDDFIGHIGGDDFVFITTPDRYKFICEDFIRMFDNIIPFHYTPKDRQLGFIVARDRSHKINKIPLMSVSMAVVNRNQASDLNNIVQLNERVAEVKRYLKSFPGCKFMIDRRSSRTQDDYGPQIYKKEESQQHPYRPLGQILLEKNIVSYEQLDEALRLHWKKGVALGDVLKELGFLKEEQLQQALEFQRSGVTLPELSESKETP
ncbi:MAG TPA: diguanylate cyclase [Patescibacteria group bacterium]|nr:diguanylate cyclase [Patescibacteria group bacterium]